MNKLTSAVKHNLMALRHGHSLFNQRYDEFLRKYPNLSYLQAENHSQYQQVVNHRTLIDSLLSKKGIQQCTILRDTLCRQQFQLILVSPLQRALQTAKIVFSGRQKSTKIQVLPQLSQAIRYACDISDISISQKQQRYREFDFQAMERTSEHWFMDLMQQKQKALFFELRNMNIHLLDLSQVQMALFMIHNRLLYTSDEHIRITGQKLKQIIFNKSLLYKKIGIISHWYTIEHLLKSQMINKNTKNMQIQNAQPYWLQIDKMLNA